MGRPREHDDDTRAALIAAAGELLATEGQSAVSIRRVADATGTSTRAVYSVFGSKDGLLRALFREAAETMRRHHEGVPVRDDPVAELLDLALAYRAAAWEQPNLYDLYLGRAVPGLRLTADDIALAYRSFERVLATLERCADAGLLGGRDPQHVGRQMWAVVHGLASLELHGFLGDRTQATDRWRDATAAAMAGYRVPPS